MELYSIKNQIKRTVTVSPAATVPRIPISLAIASSFF